MKHRGFELISASKYLEKKGVSALYSLSHSISHSPKNNMIYLLLSEERGRIMSTLTILIKFFLLGIAIGIINIAIIIVRYYLKK